MEQKKSSKADLESKKVIYRQIGLIIALAVVLFAFEWKTYDKTIGDLGQRQMEDIPEEMVEITVQETKPPPPPPPKQVVQINIVDDDIEVDDDIMINVEADQSTEMQAYIPVRVEDEADHEETTIFMVVESMPVFPGGEANLYKFLAENIKYPQMAKESGIQGRVFVTFVVERDGSVTDVRVLRGIGGGCDEEAIRVVRNMPKWTPGKQRNKAVRVQYNLPVKFTLQ
ncbi:MAG: TonB family protein [Bacteroidales bacterium]|nr:TonB family protein [Bacteroidales bacterium]